MITDKQSFLSDDLIWLSLGENCFIGNLIERFNLKTQVSPYCFSGCNIDHAIFLEETRYQTLIVEDPLKINKDGHVFNSAILSDDLFSEQSSGGFLFGHHDIRFKRSRLSLQRKIGRMLELRDSLYPKAFLYHHRVNKNTNIPKIVAKIKKFSSFYKNSSFALIYQNKISDSADRKLEINVIDGVLVFCFHTKNTWHGPDRKIFDGICDDDLLAEMISIIRNSSQKILTLN